VKKKNKLKVFGFFSLILSLYIFSTIAAIAEWPSSLDDQIDTLTGSVSENGISRDYFIKLGPEVVPIVTQKLLKSLSEGSSPEAAQEGIIMQMPRIDQKRVRHQVGLISMQAEALQNMELSPEVRRAAITSLYQALKSPYQHSRRSAIHAAAYGVGEESVDQIIPLLNDPEAANRYVAARELAMVGNISTADKIEEILEKRKRNLTVEEVENDGSFKVGYETIIKLRSKAPATP